MWQTVAGANANNLLWLRGDTTQEVQNGGTYRNRTSVLGDIIDSTPIFSWHENFGYAALPEGMSASPNYTTFLAAKGNAVMLRRELVDTNGAFAQTHIASATINIPAEAQKKGAVISGGWMCGTNQYYITLRAFVMDADGNRSNALRYTIHCNGG